RTGGRGADRRRTRAHRADGCREEDPCKPGVLCDCDFEDQGRLQGACPDGATLDFQPNSQCRSRRIRKHGKRFDLDRDVPGFLDTDAIALVDHLVLPGARHLEEDTAGAGRGMSPSFTRTLKKTQRPCYSLFARCWLSLWICSSLSTRVCKSSALKIGVEQVRSVQTKAAAVFNSGYCTSGL